MQVKKGIPVSPGVAICPALVLDNGPQRIPRRTVAADDLAREHQRLEAALDASAQELNEVRAQTTEALGEDLAKIFSFHVGMLVDKRLVEQVKQRIDKERVTAEYAVHRVLRDLAQTFLQADSRYLQDRVSDVYDLERRVLGHLGPPAAGQSLEHLDHAVAVIAHDLAPSQTASLDRGRIKAIATDAGGQTSHTAILAHALGIPAIVGLEDLTRRCDSGDMLIIDGNRGVAIIDPDAAELMEYREELRRLSAVEEDLAALREMPAVTKDGAQITLLANIEFPSEIEMALHNGAQGIGLYRTEFHFLAADTEPTEDQQHGYYTQAIGALGGRPLTIRTLDLGADKLSRAMEARGSHVEHNPFLGCRSIRLCLQNLPLLKTQLRAILRASVEGPVRIMFPLISNVMEMRQARMILSDVKEDLDEQGVAYREDIPIGMMVEVPSAALQAKTFCAEADFFSIGTNDLIQYTVAVDRSNERIASLYSGGHPAVVMLVKEVVRAAQRGKIPVSLCGEMASEPEFTMLLLGLGLRTLSITPPAIPEIKRIIRSVSLDQCRRVARKVATFDTDREVLNYLRDQVGKILPEALDGRSIER